MSKDIAASNYQPTGPIAHYVSVLDKAASVSAEKGLVFDNEIIEAELLSQSDMTFDQVRKAQDIGADVSAALLYVGSGKSIGHIAENPDTARVAGKMAFGRNELTYSFQSMAKETNADGTAKNPVVSVIHRQYEAEAYRDIRKDVMVRAQSLRD